MRTPHGLAWTPVERNYALEDLRHYLTQWRRWVMSWRAPLGLPSQWILAKVPVKAPVACGNVDDALDEPYRYEEEIESHVLKAVNAEVESLPPVKRAAVRLMYLREQPGMAVFQSGRMSLESAAQLCDEAELEMIPRLRARGVILGGY